MSRDYIALFLALFPLSRLFPLFPLFSGLDALEITMDRVILHHASSVSDSLVRKSPCCVARTRADSRTWRSSTDNTRTEWTIRRRPKGWRGCERLTPDVSHSRAVQIATGNAPSQGPEAVMIRPSEFCRHRTSTGTSVGGAGCGPVSDWGARGTENRATRRGSASTSRLNRGDETKKRWLDCEEGR